MFSSLLKVSLHPIRSAKMFVSFAAAIIYMAVFVSATPLSTPTCRPQFKDTLYNVVSSTSSTCHIDGLIPLV